MLEADLQHPTGIYDHLDEIQLVDCREPYEWNAGRIEGAIHPPTELDHRRRRFRPGQDEAGRRRVPDR